MTDEDIEKVALAATGHKVALTRRFTDGSFSTSSKVTAMNNPDIVCVVQLRFHGNVASMDALMKFVDANSRGVIPMPTVYSAQRVYPKMSHADRLELVRKMALAWQACWDLPLPSPRQVGELIAVDNSGSISLAVGPDRHYTLEGPFTSIIDWTKIPQTVEECSIVALHVDIGLHNVIVSGDNHSEINAIIDWELCASAPFLAAHSCLEMLFHIRAPNASGPEYPQAHQQKGRPKSFLSNTPRFQISYS